jgi:hypothetical protein
MNFVISVRVFMIFVLDVISKPHIRVLVGAICRAFVRSTPLNMAPFHLVFNSALDFVDNDACDTASGR